jgi:hypothetical protein
MDTKFGTQPHLVSAILTCVSILSFISSMTANLAWPVFTLFIIWILRNPIKDLIGRIRHVKWREAEADLDSVVRAGRDVQEAVDNATRDLPEADKERVQESVERVMIAAAEWGFELGKIEWVQALPKVEITWDSSGRPQLSASVANVRPHLVSTLIQTGMTRSQAEQLGVELEKAGWKYRGTAKFPSLFSADVEAASARDKLTDQDMARDIESLRKALDRINEHPPNAPKSDG